MKVICDLTLAFPMMPGTAPALFVVTFAEQVLARQSTFSVSISYQL